MLNYKIEFVNGLILNNGYIAPFFATNTENNICELENPLILLANTKVTSLQSIYKYFELAVPHGKFLLIIAEDVDFELLATLI